MRKNWWALSRKCSLLGGTRHAITDRMIKSHHGQEERSGQIFTGFLLQKQGGSWREFRMGEFLQLL